MNAKRKIILILAFTLGWGSPLASLFSHTKPVPVSFEISFPKAAVDFSDLDLRDENNRPVKSPVARERMEALFITSLNQLLMAGLTPAKQMMIHLMETSWNLFCGWFEPFQSPIFEKTFSSLATLRWFGGMGGFRTSIAPPGWGHQLTAERHSFQFLISSILSSTNLRR